MDADQLGQLLAALGQISTPGASGKIWPQFRAWVSKLGTHAAMHWPLSAVSGARCQLCTELGVVVCLVCRHSSCLDHAAVMSNAQAVCVTCIATIRPKANGHAKPPRPAAGMPPRPDPPRARPPPPPPVDFTSPESTADFVNRVMRDFMNGGRPQGRAEYAPPHRPGVPPGGGMPWGFSGAASQRIDAKVVEALNTLKLPYSASYADVKRRVKQLVVELHPDFEQDPARKAEKQVSMRKVLVAFETLKNSPAYAAEQQGARA